MHDHYPPSPPSPITSELPALPEHSVEVSPEREPLVLDEASFQELQNLSNEEVEKRAASFGVTVNSGIVAINVDGEKRYINTSFEDFGTRVRHVKEVEGSLERDTTTDVSLGETTLELVALDQPKSSEVVSNDDNEIAQTTQQFNEQAKALVADFIKNAQEADVLMRGSIETLDPAKRMIERDLEESAQRILGLQRELDMGSFNAGAAYGMFGEIESMLRRVQSTIQIAGDTFNKITAHTNQLDGYITQSIDELGAHVDQFVGEVNTKMTPARTSGEDGSMKEVDRVSVKAGEVKRAEHDFQEVLHEMTTELARINNGIEGVNGIVAQLLDQSRRLAESAVRGYIESDETAAFYRAIHQVVGEYANGVNAPLMRLPRHVDSLSMKQQVIRNMYT